MNTDTRKQMKHLYLVAVLDLYRFKFDENEPLEIALVDLVTDMLHLSDTLPEVERSYTEPTDNAGFRIASTALMHYEDELEELHEV